MPTIIEKHPAVVARTDDDKKLGRIKVKCVALLGDDTTAINEWIDPTFDWGWFYVPDVDEEVEIECVAHDETSEGVPGQAFLESPRFRWRGKRFRSDEGTAPRPPDALFTAKNYGKRRGFATPSGHVIMFDDTLGQEEVTIAWRTKGGDASFLTFDKNGSITLNNKNGAALFMDAVTKTLSLVNEKSLLSISETGVSVIDQFSNVIELKDGLVQVLSHGDVMVKAASNATVQAPKVSVDSPDVLIGTAADSPFVRYTEWLAWANAHVHTTAFGPSSPPVPLPATLPLIASTLAKVK